MRNLILLTLLILLVLVSLEYALRILPNSYKLKSYGLNKDVASIETLALGSSHTLYAINPKYFTSKTFNAANVSQSPDLDLAILNTYSHQLKKLKTVVIRLSYDTLFEELKNSSEDWRLKDYKLYTDIQFGYNFKHNSEVLSMGTQQCLKILKNYYIDNQPLLNCDSLGWGNDIHTKPRLNLQEAGKFAAKKHTAESWELLNQNIERFKKIIVWCERKGVEVYLVTFPAHKGYRDNLNKDQLTEMIKVGEQLQKRYSNCSYYNFMHQNDFTEKHFYDGDHLNGNGAKKISMILDRLIEN